LPAGYDFQAIAFASVANSCHARGVGGHKLESGRSHAWPNSVWKFQVRESILAKQQRMCATCRALVLYCVSALVSKR